MIAQAAILMQFSNMVETPPASSNNLWSTEAKWHSGKFAKKKHQTITKAQTLVELKPIEITYKLKVRAGNSNVTFKTFIFRSDLNYCPFLTIFQLFTSEKSLLLFFF